MFENIFFVSFLLGLLMGYYEAKDDLFISTSRDDEFRRVLVVLLFIILIVHGIEGNGVITSFISFIQWALGAGLSRKFFNWKLSKYR